MITLPLHLSDQLIQSIHSLHPDTPCDLHIHNINIPWASHESIAFSFITLIPKSGIDIQDYLLLIDIHEMYILDFIYAPHKSFIWNSTSVIFMQTYDVHIEFNPPSFRKVYIES